MAKAVQRGSGQSTGTTMGSASQRGGGGTDGSPTDKSDVLQEALRRADEAWTAERLNVTEARDCQSFYAGGAAQWDVTARDSRQKKNRPVLTINRLPQFVRQMTGDVRKNPPALKCLPARGPASKETAEALNGIIRNIEQQSQAKDVYVKAVENAAQTGQGFFQIETEYSSDDAFDLDIRIRPILDPCGALIDPFAQLFDKSDMRYAFTFEFMSRQDFSEEFPDSAAVDMPAGYSVVSDGLQWRVNDAIRIGAYWRKVPVKKKLYLLPDGTTVDDKAKIPKPGPQEMPPEQADAMVEQAIATGQIKTRDVEGHKVEMYRMTGADILDGPHAWAGRYIPICMVVGEEITTDGRTIRKGMVHDARDPQRIYNYSRSASVEAVALQPKAPYVGTVDMFRNRPEWATAGSENHAFLAANPDPKMPGRYPERSQPAIASQGLDTQAAIAASDMQAVTGIYNDNLGAPSTQHSGVAINAKKVEGDTGTFLYPDNLSRAIGYAGKILVDLIPRIYDSQRQVRILKEDGGAEMVTVNGQPQPNPKTGEPSHPLYDLSAGEYDVIVTTGPSFATQRQEAAANMIEMVRAVPQIFPVVGDLVFKNMDWPGADEMAARLRKAAGIPEDGEPPPPPPPPSPDVIAKAQKDEAEADKTRAEADGQKIDNAMMLAQMHATLQGIQQMLAGGAPMGGPPGMSQPGAPMPAPPPAPPNGMGGPPPMNVGGEGDLPPMVEVGDMPPGVAPV